MRGLSEVVSLLLAGYYLSRATLIASGLAWFGSALGGPSPTAMPDGILALLALSVVWQAAALWKESRS